MYQTRTSPYVRCSIGGSRHSIRGAAGEGDHEMRLNAKGTGVLEDEN